MYINIIFAAQVTMARDLASRFHHGKCAATSKVAKPHQRPQSARVDIDEPPEPIVGALAPEHRLDRRWTSGSASGQRQTCHSIEAPPIHTRALTATEAAPSPERAAALRLLAANLHKAFHAFKPDFFQHHLLRMVDDVVRVIKASLQLWPTLVEIRHFQRDRKGLPQIRVSHRKTSSTQVTPHHVR